MMIRIDAPTEKARTIKNWVQMRFGAKVFQSAPDSGGITQLTFDAPLKETLRWLLEVSS